MDGATSYASPKLFQAVTYPGCNDVACDACKRVKSLARELSGHWSIARFYQLVLLNRHVILAHVEVREAYGVVKLCQLLRLAIPNLLRFLEVLSGLPDTTSQRSQKASVPRLRPPWPLPNTEHSVT